jgi:Ca2+-binding EF-hand superfamily protein
VFDAVDSNASGRLSNSEVRNALRKAGFDASTADLTALFAHFDVNGDGMISKQEVVDAIAPRSTLAAAADASSLVIVKPLPAAEDPLLMEAKAILDRISFAFANKDARDVAAAFAAVDFMRTGTLSQSLFGRVMASCGYELMSSELATIARAFGEFRGDDDRDAVDDVAVAYLPFLRRVFPQQMGLAPRSISRTVDSRADLSPLTMDDRSNGYSGSVRVVPPSQSARRREDSSVEEDEGASPPPPLVAGKQMTPAEIEETVAWRLSCRDILLVVVCLLSRER